MTSETTNLREQVADLQDQVTSLREQLDAAHARVSELFQSNNEYLMRARAAEQLAHDRLVVVTGQAMMIGQLGHELAASQEEDDE